MNLNDKEESATFYVLKEIRSSVNNALQELRSQYITEISDSNDIPSFRANFVDFARKIEAKVKQFNLIRNENLVVAQSFAGDQTEVLKIAVAASQRGHTEIATELLQLAAVNSFDMLTPPTTPYVHNECGKCHNLLPTVANFCPHCGVKLDNYRPSAEGEEILTPAKTPELIHLPLAVQSTYKALIEAGKNNEAQILLSQFED